MIVKGGFTVRWAAQDGRNGTGVTIRTTSIKYAESTSGTVRPTSGWGTTVPQVTNGNFLWTWTHIEYSDSTQTDSYSVARMGIDGKGIQESVITYSQQSTPVDPATISNWGPFPSQLEEGKWLYTKTHIVYSGTPATTSDSYSVSQVGVGAYYLGCEEHYEKGSSDTVCPQGAITAGTYTPGNLPTTTWGQSRPDLDEDEPYLWNFEISYDSRGNAYVTNAICIGNFAKGIASIVQTYATSAYSTIDPSTEKPAGISDNDWTDEAHQVAPTSEKPYMWNKTVTTYNDGDEKVSYHICAVAGKGAIFADLDNENDTMIYNGKGDLMSGSVTSQARLYSNGAALANNPITWSLDSKTGAANATIDSSGVVTVPGLDSGAQKATIKVKAAYPAVNPQYYYAILTIKRVTNRDKYELVLSHQAMTYNTDTTDLTPSSLTVNVYRTDGKTGVRKRVGDDNDSISALNLSAKIWPNGINSGAIDVTFNNSTNVGTVEITKQQAAAWGDFAIVLFRTVSGTAEQEDFETVSIPKVKDGAKGDNAVILDLDNENDTMLYDQKGNLLSGNVTSNAKLYVGGEDKTSEVTSWEGVASSVNGSIFNGVVTIRGVTADSGKYTVKATYNGKVYQAILTIKRLIGQDKYSMVVSPNAITLNTSSTMSTQTITVTATRLKANGVSETVSLNSATSGIYCAAIYSSEAHQGSSFNITQAIALANDTIRIELRKVKANMVYNKDNASTYTVEDFENIPISKVHNGSNSNVPGPQGDSVEVVESYFKLTATMEEPSYEELTTANGWYKQDTAGCPTATTQDMPFLWKCDVYKSDASGNPTISKTLSLSQKGAGTCPNLLEQTPFVSDNLKDPFDLNHTVGHMVPEARGDANSWGNWPVINTNNSQEYRNMMMQVVCKPQGIQKIEPGKWYTFSFYARTRKYVNKTFNINGFNMEKIWLTQGKYRVQINGRISQEASNAGVSLRLYFVSVDLSWQSAFMAPEITELKDTTKISSAEDNSLITISAAQEGYYFVYPYAYNGGTWAEVTQNVTLNWYRILAVTGFPNPRGGLNGYDSYFSAHLYPGMAKTGSNVKFYVDGKVRTNPPANCDVVFYPDRDMEEGKEDSQGWVFHSASFLMADSFNANEYKQFLIRQFATWLEICQPKLEQCSIPSPWVPNEKDEPMEFTLQPAGTFDPQGTYFYYDGVRDCVLANSLSEGTDMRWYRLKKKTNYEGLKGTAQNPLPQPRDDAEHWEQSQRLKWFITDAMFAEDIYTERITARRAKILDENNTKGLLMDPDTDYPLRVGPVSRQKFKVNMEGKMFSDACEVGECVYIEDGVIKNYQGNNVNYPDASLVLLDSVSNTKKYIRIGMRPDSLDYLSGFKYMGKIYSLEQGYNADTNICFWLRAENAPRNFAFVGSGHGVLNGLIDGYAYSKVQITSTSMYMQLHTHLRKANRLFVTATVNGCSAVLPTRQDIADKLFIGTDKPFCLRLFIQTDPLSPYKWKLYGRSTVITAIKSNDYPLWFDQDGILSGDAVEMDPCDSVEVLLVYDPDRTDTYNNNDMKYTARTISRFE